MRKIIAIEFYTIDGMMADTHGSTKWASANFNEAMMEYYASMYRNADILLLGAVTFDILKGFFQFKAFPDSSLAEVELAKRTNSIHKIVFSKSNKTMKWQNTESRSEIDPKELNDLKQTSRKDIILIGSASIVQQLTNMDLIDEYHLLMYPLILGGGKPLFENIQKDKKLILLGTQNFDNGVMLLKYIKLNN